MGRDAGMRPGLALAAGPVCQQGALRTQRELPFCHLKRAGEQVASLLSPLPFPTHSQLGVLNVDANVWRLGGNEASSVHLPRSAQISRGLISFSVCREVEVPERRGERAVKSGSCRMGRKGSSKELP